MSRSNPYKRKKRCASKTILIFGEGFNDGIFLKHLKKLYSFNSGVEIKIRQGKGGSAGDIVSETINAFGAFDKRIVMLDNDKPKNEMNSARSIAKIKGIELIESTPCLEYLFLSIIDKEPKKRNSAWCKKEFEAKFLNKNKRSEPNEYDKLFPKALLYSKMSKIPELEKLILIMKGK